MSEIYVMLLFFWFNFVYLFIYNLCVCVCVCVFKKKKLFSILVTYLIKTLLWVLFFYFSENKWFVPTYQEKIHLNATNYFEFD